MDTTQPDQERRSIRLLGLEVSFTSRTSKRTWRSVPVLGTVIGTLLVGGVAYAAVTPWAVSGSGQGASAAGTANTFGVSAAVVNSNALFPGGSGDVLITLTNPYPFNVSVSALTTSGTVQAFTTQNGTTGALSGTTGNAATCQPLSGVSWKTSPTKTLTTAIVVGANSSYTLTLTGNALMSTSSDNSCQGLFFSMPISGITAVQTASASSGTSGTQS